MYILVIIIHVIACIILITAILLQSGKGGGLAGLFGSGPTQTIFGARASTFLTRATTVAAVAFLLSCISLTILSRGKGKSLLEEKGVLAEDLTTENSEVSESELPTSQEEE